MSGKLLWLLGFMVVGALCVAQAKGALVIPCAFAKATSEQLAASTPPQQTRPLGCLTSSLSAGTDNIGKTAILISDTRPDAFDYVKIISGSDVLDYQDRGYRGGWSLWLGNKPNKDGGEVWQMDIEMRFSTMLQAWLLSMTTLHVQSP